MNVPNTLVRTTHALTIKINGNTIGLINGWNPAQSRAVTPIFELDVDNSGNPIECMPGNIGGLTVGISRYDIYTKRMEEVFDTPDLVMLTRQSEPFDVHEVWEMQHGANLIYERFIYSGCWFTSLGRTLRSDDIRIVNVNGTLMYTKKMKVTGMASGILNLPGIPSLSQVLGV